MDKPTEKSLDEKIKVIRNCIRRNEWEHERGYTEGWNGLTYQIIDEDYDDLTDLILKKYDESKKSRA